MKDLIDLHSHSTASDGTFTPRQLVEYAASKHIKTLALTDHDTVDGLLEAQQAASEQGITFIPGLELNITWPTGEFHLLGLGLQHVSPELQGILQFLSDGRKERNKEMAEKLQAAGVPISLDEVTERFNTKMIGRPHFAQLLVEKGIVKHRQLAFDKFFAKGRPCFVDRAGADLEEAVQAIKTSGGVPVQAHPLSMYVSWGKMDDTMIQIQEKGVMGLEAWHPGVRRSEAERLEELGHKLNMIVTAGSDFHGEKVRTDRHLGYTAGGACIGERFWTEELRPLLQKMHQGDSLTFQNL